MGEKTLMGEKTTSDAVRIERLPDEPASPPSTIVSIPMIAADRRRVRRRVFAPDGSAFELALPTGTVLPSGGALHVAGEVVYRIAAAPERVLVVRPRSIREAALVGHLIGNLHRDVDLRDDVIVALWDAPLERRLAEADLDYEVAEQPFRGRPPGEHAH